jgi:hypothetical protein
MSNEKTVPAATWLAARRGFIRTTAQSYAAALPVGGVNVAALAALTELGTFGLTLTIVAWVLAPLIAGLASFLSIVGGGIPSEYAAAVPFDNPPDMR